MIAWWKRGVLVAYLYVCWLGMLATHEAGHVLHAWLSGGRLVRVVLPWFGFSRTDLAHNPHPLFVAWGGVLWGSLIPLVLLTLAATRGFRFLRWVQFFAGFCLIANGAYLGAGSLIGAGDAGDLLRHGTPLWLLVVTGVVEVAAGLFIWHRLGLRQPPNLVHTSVSDENSAER